MRYTDVNKALGIAESVAPHATHVEFLLALIKYLTKSDKSCDDCDGSYPITMLHADFRGGKIHGLYCAECAFGEEG